MNKIQTVGMIDASLAIRLERAAQNDKCVSVYAFPNCAPGYCTPKGTAIVLEEGFVSPTAVGIDIGCGITMAKAKGISVDSIMRRAEFLARQISLEVHSSSVSKEAVTKNLDTALYSSKRHHWNENSILSDCKEKSAHQLGTLGGGDHYINVCKVINVDRNPEVYIIVHTGSRGLGSAVFSHYLKDSVDNKNDPFEPLVLDMKDTDYGLAHDTCIEWAKFNRLLILQKVGSILKVESLSKIIDKPHNYIAHSEYLGGNVHRKGLQFGQPRESLYIGGSFSTLSSIVSIRAESMAGKACNSLPAHGNRIISRSSAKKSFTYKDVDEQGKLKSIAHIGVSPENLSNCYKNMTNINDILESKGIIEVGKKYLKNLITVM